MERLMGGKRRGHGAWSADRAEKFSGNDAALQVHSVGHTRALSLKNPQTAPRRTTEAAT